MNMEAAERERRRAIVRVARQPSPVENMAHSMPLSVSSLRRPLKATGSRCDGVARWFFGVQQSSARRSL